jgi:hypothetical protein
MLHKSGSVFDEEATIVDLIDKYGVEEEVVAPSSSPSKGKRKADVAVKKEKDETEVASPTSAAKKVRKTEVVAVEQNRAAAEAIKEMADIYFKAKDMRKGGAFVCCKGVALLRASIIPLITIQLCYMVLTLVQ